MARRLPLHIVNRVVKNLAQQECVISFGNRWINAAEHLFQKLGHFFASGRFDQSVLLVRLCFPPLIVRIDARQVRIYLWYGAFPQPVNGFAGRGSRFRYSWWVG